MTHDLEHLWFLTWKRASEQYNTTNNNNNIKELRMKCYNVHEYIVDCVTNSLESSRKVWQATIGVITNSVYTSRHFTSCSIECYEYMSNRPMRTITII